MLFIENKNLIGIDKNYGLNHDFINKNFYELQCINCKMSLFDFKLCNASNPITLKNCKFTANTISIPNSLYYLNIDCNFFDNLFIEEKYINYTCDEIIIKEIIE